MALNINLPSFADHADGHTAAHNATNAAVNAAAAAADVHGAATTNVHGIASTAALATTAAVAAGYQPLDSDLTAIAALSPAADDLIQRKAGAWTNRTIIQLVADLVPTTPTPREILSDSKFSSSSASMDLTTDSGTQVGDTLLLIHGSDNGTLAGMPAPTGTIVTWTTLDTADLGSVSSSHLKVMTGVVTVAGAQTVSVARNPTGADERYLALYVLPVGTTVEAADAVAVSSASASLSTPTVTSLGTNRLLISAWLNEYDSGTGAFVLATSPGTEKTRSTQVGSAQGTMVTATANVGAGTTTAQTITGSPGTHAYVAASILVRTDSLPDGLLDALLSHVPSLEELQDSRAIGAVSATATHLLGTACFDQRIGALSLAATGAIAASDTNYWTVALHRYRAGSSATIATRTTQVSAPNGGVTANTAWTFDLAAFANQTLQKDDVLAVTFTSTGSPTAWAGAVASWRYEPGVS